MNQLSELLCKTNLTNAVTKELYTRSISKLEFDDRGYLMNEPVESNKELLVVIKVLANEIDRLEYEVQNFIDQEEAVANLMADIENLESDISNLNELISELGDTITDKDAIIEDLESDKKILELDKKDLLEEIQIINQHNPHD
jgi:hypothetical protein